MFSTLRTLLLRFVKLPPEPAAPAGAPGSVRVFRAAENFYRLSLLGWFVAQLATLVGIVVSLAFLWELQSYVKTMSAPTAPDAARAPPQAETPAASKRENVTAPAGTAPTTRGKRTDRQRRSPQELARHVEPHAWWLFPLINLAEAVGVVAYVVQLFATGFAQRLNFELRWYIVTDRSLRIRSGIWSVQEVTMSFANIQQVMVSQGPLQRLLGLADVRVQSAGGGGGSGESGKHSKADSMHTGVFHGVTQAHEIRDLVLERLRLFRQAGLGDPDERHHDMATSAQPDTLARQSEVVALVAARELLHEVRLLREQRVG